ncbi:MAG TPA: TadE/TadG family type IV pilus assembly protein [Geminicoccaceae bacterium]|nr:TadE/TadG family type IV pilus assembly protein [Geminicoccaceae bacterium]
MVRRLRVRMGRRLRDLLRDQRGAVMAIVGLAIIPLFGMVGLAVDVGRGFLVKSRLSQAIDAAALAGGRAFDQSLRGDDITMFFEANFPADYMGAVLDTGDPRITFDDQRNTITIEARATIPTTFMAVTGIHEMTVAARTVVERELRGMELVLVMDNTGSMRSGAKIDAMKDAATDLINILFGNRETVENFWVGVVPYVATVNIGSHRTDWLIQGAYNANAMRLAADPNGTQRFGYHPNHYAPSVWKGCVEARPYPRDSNDDPPSVEKWYPFLFKTTKGRFANPYWNPSKTTYNGNDPASWGQYLNGDNEWDPSGPRSALKEANSAENEGTGPNLGCGPAITSLTQSKARVLAAIDEMLPWHRGGTTSNIGLTWGWRVISPRWRGLWGGDTPEDMPLDYNTPLMHKVVILLTDGNNEWYDWDGVTKTISSQTHYWGLPGANKYPTSLNGFNYQNKFKNDWPGADYTAYGRLNEARLGTTNNGTAKNTIDQRMRGLCEAMKAENILLYTITFQVTTASTQDMFRDCATSPDRYFNSPTNADLERVFKAIAEQLSNLRIAE